MMGRLTVEAGKTIAKRYRVERRVGTGAMGEVWAGQRLSDGRSVALKLLLGVASDQREVLARFRREAQVLARVRSDYVSEVLDFFTDHELGMVLVMDLIPGKTLHRVIWEEKKLSIEATNDMAADVLRGLRDLHAANVVHRDLKPGNIVLSPRGEARARAIVIDFGVSRIISSQGEEEVTAITRAGRVLGTLEYMAPEQILGSRTVTPTADLYALGAIMFRAISGEHVHGDLKEGQLALAKLNQDPRALPTDRDDEVAVKTAAFVAKLLSRRSGERFESAEDALEALAEFREPSVVDRLVAGWDTDGDIDLAATVVREAPISPQERDDLAKTLMAVRPGHVAPPPAPPAPGGAMIDDEETVDRGPPPSEAPARRPVSRAPPPLPPTPPDSETGGLERSSSSQDVVRISSGDVMLSSSLDPVPATPAAAGFRIAEQPGLAAEGAAVAPAPGEEGASPSVRPRSRWRAMGSVVLFSALGAFGGALFGVSYLQGGKAYELVHSLRTAVAGRASADPVDPAASADAPETASIGAETQLEEEPVPDGEPGDQEEDEAEETPGDEATAEPSAEPVAPATPTYVRPPPPRRPAPRPPSPPPTPKTSPPPSSATAAPTTASTTTGTPTAPSSQPSSSPSSTATTPAPSPSDAPAARTKPPVVDESTLPSEF